MMISYFTAGRKGNMEKLGYIAKPQHLLSSFEGKKFKEVLKRSYKFIFYTQLSLEFKIYTPECIVNDLNT